MNDQQYLDHCLNLLAEFADGLARRTASLPEGDGLRELAQGFLTLLQPGEEDVHTRAQPLVDRLFTTYPDFAPTLPRELLWFFGGDCLHFMPDEEIALYQQLDELRHEAAGRGEIMDLRATRAKLLQLQ
ncbi:MAG: hypothetical protein KDI21_12060 [Halieaceae bacterium]|nr:hypothetical protein [Halieaceae bacterium]